MMEIMLLPLDDRPVNFDDPALLAAVAGVKLRLPPREWLGNPWRASNHSQLISWLKENAPSANALVLALDTLAYGGLIPSRQLPDPIESINRRLEILREIKHLFPSCSITAFSVILRINRSNSSEEEKPYWAEFGSRMFRLSYLEHKTQCGDSSPDEIAERDRLINEIPAEVIADYRSLRQRNHAINRFALDLVREGVIEYLLLPQDDTADYGWNIAEARNLQRLIRLRRLEERAITYPGADEVGTLLVARQIATRADFRPRVFPRFSSSVSATCITEYEDRPLAELLKAHLAPLGGILVDTSDDADIQLFINAPAIRQGVGEWQWIARLSPEEWEQEAYFPGKDHLISLFLDPHFRATRREMETPLRSPEEFTRAILTALREKKNVALADVAFVNGSDLILCDQLLRYPEIAHLAGYAGWNTAGNTLGSALAHAVVYTVAKQNGLLPIQQKAHLTLLFRRFLDDYAYQAIERSRCMLEDLPALGLQPTEERLPDSDVARQITHKIAERLTAQAARLEEIFCSAGMVKKVRLTDVYLPWQRLFEVGFNLEVELP